MKNSCSVIWQCKALSNVKVFENVRVSIAGSEETLDMGLEFLFASLINFIQNFFVSRMI